MGDGSWVYIASQYVTSHSHQLSLLTSAGLEMSPGQWLMVVFCNHV